MIELLSLQEFSLRFFQLLIASRFLFYNIKIIMPQNKENWTHQEDKFIIEIANQFKIHVRINWNKFFRKFYETFPSTNRTSKQCKERYTSLLTSADCIRENLQWTSGQSFALMGLYLSFGSSWTFIRQSIPNRSVKSIKNKFYSNLRKGIVKLNSFIENQNKRTLNITYPINFQVVRVLLDMTNKLKKWANEKSLTISQTSKFFHMRDQTIKYCFLQNSFQQNRIKDLLHKIKTIAFDLKSFKIFKSQHRNNFGVDKTFLRKIYGYDKFVNEQMRMGQLLLQESTTKANEDLIQAGQSQSSDSDNQLSQLSLPQLIVGETERKCLQDQVSFLIGNQMVARKLSFFQIEDN